MRKAHNTVRQTLLALIDLLYPIFKGIMPLETFRYAACGGFNTSLDISLFFVSYNYLYKAKPVNLAPLFPDFYISAHIAAFITGFLVTFPIGFYLSRYVVFQETSQRKSKQLFKYFSVVLICLLLNYGFLKLFVEKFGWYPTPSKLVTTVFVVAFSYIAQKYFTFTNKATE